MASAGELLGGARASSASERLASNGKPSGKQGSPALTVKLRTKFAEEAADQPGIQFEDWLEQNGYAGVARVRATKGAQLEDPVCEQVMEFEIVPTDPPAGHRGRGSASMDPAYWKVERLTRKPGG